MKITEMRISEGAGQHCDIVIMRRHNGTVCVRFEHAEHYGYPHLELAELERLLQKMRTLAQADE